MRRPSTPRPGGLSTQQIMILSLVAVLGLSAFGLAAFLILTGPAPSPNARVAPAARVESTLTTAPGPAALLSVTPGITQAVPTVTERCAQSGTALDQGKVTRIIDTRTIEVQVNEKLLRVGYAGIRIPPAGTPGQANTSTTEQLALQKERELLEGQVVMLVKDVTEQDSAGRSARYVFANGQFINLELVRLGLAGIQPDGPDRACAVVLQQGEQQARAASLGWWSLAPVPTRTFMPLVTLDTSKAPCDCSRRYVCSDFRTHAEAQACFNVCNDYSSKLDDNHDGIACEDLP